MEQGRVSGLGFLEGSSISLLIELLNTTLVGLGFLLAKWDEAPFTGAPTSGHKQSTCPGPQPRGGGHSASPGDNRLCRPLLLPAPRGAQSCPSLLVGQPQEKNGAPGPAALHAPCTLLTIPPHQPPKYVCVFKFCVCCWRELLPAHLPDAQPRPAPGHGVVDGAHRHTRALQNGGLSGFPWQERKTLLFGPMGATPSLCSPPTWLPRLSLPQGVAIRTPWVHTPGTRHGNTLMMEPLPQDQWSIPHARPQHPSSFSKCTLSPRRPSILPKFSHLPCQAQLADRLLSVLCSPLLESSVSLLVPPPAAARGLAGETRLR